MKIEIDLADLGFHYDEDGDAVGNRTLTDAILEAAAAQVATKIIRDSAAKIQSRAQEIVDAQIHTAVSEVFENPIQRVQPWGDKVGTPVTVKELIRESVEKFLNESSRRRDSFSNSQPPTNLREMIDEATKNILGGDLKAAIAEVRKEIHSTLTEKAIRGAAEALAKP